MYLKIRRRRWRHKQDPKKIIRNDFLFVADGAGFTRELSDFQKEQVDTREDTITNISSYYAVTKGKLNRHYKKYSSGFTDWELKAHAEQYLLFEENMSEYLSMDEVSLSQGEFYTFVTNKAGKGKKEHW